MLCCWRFRTHLLRRPAIARCVSPRPALQRMILTFEQKWEICIPTEKVKEAVDILRQRNEYIQTNEKRISQPMSLAHTYTWFRGNIADYEFCLVPSTHARIPVDKSAVCRSPNGVPYAPLKDVVQSYSDMHDRVSLCDIVDGANLSYRWGQLHLI